MQSDVEHILTRVPLFRQLGRAEMLDIARTADMRDYPAGEAIVNEGDPSESFYVVVRGAAEVRKERTEGEPLVLTILRDGDYFGELSIFDEQPRSATVRSTDDTTCLVIPRWEILQAVAASSEVSRRMLAYLSSRLRAATDALPFD